MARTALKVLLADIVLVAAVYSVIRDLGWRASYAASPHASAINGYSSSISYSILTQFFTMSGSGVRLTSPPTLDWVQLIAAALVVLNQWYAYTILARRRARPLPEPAAEPTPA